MEMRTLNKQSISLKVMYKLLMLILGLFSGAGETKVGFFTIGLLLLRIHVGLPVK